MPIPSLPAYISQPFALNGNKNTIPIMPDGVPGHASLETGWPPLTMTPVEDGGVPPSGLDFNGIVNWITQHTTWGNAGGRYPFIPALSALMGGYPLNAILVSNDGRSEYISLVNGNTTDFNSTPSSIGTLWAPYAGQALANGATVISTTGGTTTLSAAQAANPFITVTGVLASDATLVFPNTVRGWTIINNTTGAFAVNAKAAAGLTLPCTQGRTNEVFYNGASLVYPDYDSGIHSPAFDGVPTAPTAAPGTNTDQLATMAALQTAIAAAVLNVSSRYINGAFTVTGSADLWVDTSATAFSITLPAAPVTNLCVYFRDVGASWDSNNLTILRNGKNIDGVAEDLLCNVRGEQFGLWYDSVNNNWKVI